MRGIIVLCMKWFFRSLTTDTSAHGRLGVCTFATPLPIHDLLRSFPILANHLVLCTFAPLCDVL